MDGAAVAYRAVGVPLYSSATFAFAPGRQYGLLAFSVLGLVLGAAVLLSGSTS